MLSREGARQGGTCVSFIDVGKGDCFLLQAGGAAALIDTGYKRTSDAVVRHLREKGVDRLEFLVITHYDRDHIGGVRAIGERLAIGMVFLPAYEGADKNYHALMSAVADLGLPVRRVGEPLSLELGGALLSVFPSGVAYVADAKGDEGNDNDLSLVATLVNGADRFLFTGDLEKDGLEAYLGAPRGRFDVLKVPCHGEKCPYTDELLEGVAPRIAIVTDGVGEPADKKTLKLLAEAGAEVYRTSEVGTVVVEGDGAGNYAVTCRGSS